jgi:hypothetical protein
MLAIARRKLADVTTDAPLLALLAVEVIVGAALVGRRRHERLG